MMFTLSDLADFIFDAIGLHPSSYDGLAKMATDAALAAGLQGDEKRMFLRSAGLTEFDIETAVVGV